MKCQLIGTGRVHVNNEMLIAIDKEEIRHALVMARNWLHGNYKNQLPNHNPINEASKELSNAIRFVDDLAIRLSTNKQNQMTAKEKKN